MKAERVGVAFALLSVVAVTTLSGIGEAAADALDVAPPAPATPAAAAVCAADPDPPAYYAIPLVTTSNVPGSGRSRGTAGVTYRPSPFGISIGPDGSYLYDVRIETQRIPEPRRGVYVGWVTTTQVDQVRRLGVMDEDGFIDGQVSWNKYLVVVTLERRDEPDADMWSGPIVLRGMSRSGMMHTMAGHGPFEEEKCAAYGYAN
jgi:hypothetical protein